MGEITELLAGGRLDGQALAALPDHMRKEALGGVMRTIDIEETHPCLGQRRALLPGKRGRLDLSAPIIRVWVEGVRLQYPPCLRGIFDTRPKQDDSGYVAQTGQRAHQVPGSVNV